jgi:phosphatidate cytidylyltransferase
MLRERLAVSLLLLPLAFWIISDGGALYLAGVAFALGVAAREYGALFREHGQRPAGFLVIAAVLALSAARFLTGFELDAAVLAVAILAAMAWHLVDFERGAERSATDFALTVTGIVYIGFLGAFLISLRRLPDGTWWFLTALPSVWVADSAAYMVGSAVGRRRLAPLLSPNKTWEGYLAGIVAGGAAGWAFAHLWANAASGAFRPQAGLPLGLVLASLTTLGDLGMSMIKRQIRVKDSGRFLPGHGGALDRIDSWLWAGVLGYFGARLLAG